MHRKKYRLLLILLIPFACTASLVFGYVLFPPAPVDVLILGLDTRPGDAATTQTDSIMLFNVTPAEGRVTLLSIPRDVFIDVPGYGERRINSIATLGGVDLLRASLQTSLGIEVDHVIQLDFAAFITLVDAVGGVEVNVPQRIVDDAYPTLDGSTMTVTFEAGSQHMDGERALQYARTRHQDNDFRRAGRQQQVLEAVFRKLRDPRTITRWPDVWDALQTHSDLKISTLLRIAPALLWGWPEREQRVLERDDLLPRRANYWSLDIDTLRPWIEPRFD